MNFNVETVFQTPLHSTNYHAHTPAYGSPMGQSYLYAHGPEVGGRIPRPRNAFILYRQKRSKELSSNGNHVKRLSRVIANEWKSLPEHVRKGWHDLAEVERLEHKKKYPNYVYQKSPPKKGKNGNGKKLVNRINYMSPQAAGLEQPLPIKAVYSRPPFPLPAAHFYPSPGLESCGVPTSLLPLHHYQTQTFPPFSVLQTPHMLNQDWQQPLARNPGVYQGVPQNVPMPYLYDQSETFSQHVLPASLHHG